MASANCVGSYRVDGNRVVHIYSLCFFGRDEVVPTVELIEALDDYDAMLIAKSKRPSLVREVWDRHRLVARLKSRS